MGEKYKYKSLVMGGEITTESITVPVGTEIKQGDLLGKIAISVPSSGVANGGNTGDGTLTGVLGKKDTQKGVYTLTCVEAAANGGRFQVVAPNGNVLPDCLVGVAYSTNHLDFTINDGAADYVVGDSFTVTVASGNENAVLSLAANVDGSQNPVLVAAEDVDATLASKVSLGYKTGRFNSKEMQFGAGHTVESVKENLQIRGILLEE